MFKKIVLILIVLLIASCKSYDLAGKKYSASDKEKQESIMFVNDTLCIISQKHLCDKLPKKYRSVTINATYRISKINIKTKKFKNFKSTRIKEDILIIKNLDCNNCEKYIEIPNYIDLNCTTPLNYKKFKGIIKYGLIHNFINDTIPIDKNYIFFGDLKLKQNK